MYFPVMLISSTRCEDTQIHSESLEIHDHTKPGKIKYFSMISTVYNWPVQ